MGRWLTSKEEESRGASMLLEHAQCAHIVDGEENAHGQGAEQAFGFGVL